MKHSLKSFLLTQKKLEWNNEAKEQNEIDPKRKSIEN